MNNAFNIDLRALVAASNLQSIIGKRGADPSIISCGSSKDSWFSGTGGDNKLHPSKPCVCMNIYCPKGTKMTYVANHSHFGRSENEHLLPSWTEMIITKVEYIESEDMFYIDFHVIGQKMKEFTMTHDYSLGHDGRANAGESYYCVWGNVIKENK